MRKVATVVGITILVVLAPMTGVVGATAAGEQTQSEEVTLAENNDEYELTEDGDVTIWKGAPVSLRADTDEAETVVGLHTVNFKDPDGYTGNANLPEVGVFNTGDVTLDLQDSTGPPISEYNNRNVNVIVGELHSDASIDDRDALTSLDGDSLDELNNNVDFEFQDQRGLNENGELSATYDADTGQYISFVATTDGSGDGLIANNDGDLEVTSETTILGVNSFLVQDGTSSVNPSSADLGDTVEFEADNLDTDDVAHGVALYHKDTFDEQTTTIEVTEEPDSGLSEEDITIDTSLEGVNGVANLEDDVKLFGFSQQETEETEQTDLESLLSLIPSQLDIDEDQLETGDNILDGSTTVQEESSNDESVTIDVETLEDWDEGDYQWIHVAADKDNEELRTNEGTIYLEEDDGSSGGGGGGGWAPVVPSAAIDVTPKSPSVNEDVTFSGSESSIRSTPATDGITDYEWDIDGETLSGEEVTTSFDTPGDYEVDLTVTSAEDESDTASTTVTVRKSGGDGGDDDDGGDGDGIDGDGSDGGDTGDGDTGDGDDTDGDDDGDGMPGFGAVAALIAILSSALVVTRIRR